MVKALKLDFFSTKFKLQGIKIVHHDRLFGFKTEQNQKCTIFI